MLARKKREADKRAEMMKRAIGRSQKDKIEKEKRDKKHVSVYLPSKIAKIFFLELLD